MDRERTMQRLNLLTLAAFLLGLGAFIYDSSTPPSARLSAWESASMEAPARVTAALSN